VLESRARRQAARRWSLRRGRRGRRTAPGQRRGAACRHPPPAGRVGTGMGTHRAAVDTAAGRGTL